MILIISDTEKEVIGQRLFAYYQGIGISAKLISASGCTIAPCYGCEGCTYKTYGTCVVRDDMDEIIPEIMATDVLILCSPLVWGGFSYELKKVIDKIALTGDRFYKVRNGELTKGTISNMKKIVGIAHSAHPSEKARRAFESYLREIGTIFDIDYLARVIENSGEPGWPEALAKEIGNHEIPHYQS